jgi:hypothetical protein
VGGIGIVQSTMLYDEQDRISVELAEVLICGQSVSNPTQTMDTDIPSGLLKITDQICLNLMF